MMQTETVKAAYRRYAGFYDALFGPVLHAGRKTVVDTLAWDRAQPGDRPTLAHDREQEILAAG